MCQWCLLKFWLCHDVSRHLGPENRQIARLFAQWRCSVSMDRYICMGGRPEFHNALTSATFHIWSPTDLRLISPSLIVSHLHARWIATDTVGSLSWIPRWQSVERAWCSAMFLATISSFELHGTEWTAVLLQELLAHVSADVHVAMLPMRPWHNFEVKITQLGLVFKSCSYDLKKISHAASFPHTSGIKCESSQTCQQTTKVFVFKPFFWLGWIELFLLTFLTCVHTVSSP